MNNSSELRPRPVDYSTAFARLASYEFPSEITPEDLDREKLSAAKTVLNLYTDAFANLRYRDNNSSGEFEVAIVSKDLPEEVDAIISFGDITARTSDQLTQIQVKNGGQSMLEEKVVIIMRPDENGERCEYHIVFDRLEQSRSNVFAWRIDDGRDDVRNPLSEENVSEINEIASQAWRRYNGVYP